MFACRPNKRKTATLKFVPQMRKKIIINWRREGAPRLLHGTVHVHTGHGVSVTLLASFSLEQSCSYRHKKKGPGHFTELRFCFIRYITVWRTDTHQSRRRHDARGLKSGIRSKHAILLPDLFPYTSFSKYALNPECKHMQKTNKQTKQQQLNSYSYYSCLSAASKGFFSHPGESWHRVPSADGDWCYG